jgi:hypothetical protein
MKEDIEWHRMLIRFPKDIVWYDKKRKLYWVEVKDPKKFVMGILAVQSGKGKHAVIKRDEDE